METNTNDKILYLDLRRISESFQPQLGQAVERVLHSGWYLRGETTERFEQDFARFCGTDYCVGVGNGLDALTLIFLAYRVMGQMQEGDEVIVPANTYIATILAVWRAGLRPVLCEPCADTCNLDAAEAERRREAFRARQEAQPTVAIEQPPPFDDGWDDADEAPLDVYPEDSAEPEPAPALADLEASRNLAGALCELLAHHFHEPDVMGCLIRHLPPAFVHNPFASKVYDLAVAASLNGARTLSPPDDDPAFKDYLARIFAAPDRIVAAGEDITPLTYAQDLVRAYWLREYERRAKMLDPDSIEAFTLTQSRKRLQSLSWQAAEPYLDALNPVLAAPKPAPPPPSEQSKHGEGALQEDYLPSDGDTADYDATPPPPIPDPNLPPAWDPPDEEEDIYDTL